MTHILAIDQGTTSTRAILFDGAMKAVASAQEEFPQHFPDSGWVEHDPGDLWATTAATCRAAIEKSGGAEIAAICVSLCRPPAQTTKRATDYAKLAEAKVRRREVCRARVLLTSLGLAPGHARHTCRAHGPKFKTD